jgi:signal transduction histidine kinase
MSDKPLLLLADDEAIIRNKVCLMLGDKFRIHQASTAAEARDAARNRYDAVILDIVFPDGNGIELCREIKKSDPHATVLVSSSMETVEAWNKAFEAGADGYLEKRELLGLDPRKIALTISNLMERNRLRRQTEELTRRQSELLSVLSHDVRAPFQVLLGTIEMLKKTSITQDASKNVDALYQCAKDQLAFINSLLEVLRLESGAIGLRRSVLDVNVPVAASLQNMALLASAKDISLESAIEQNLPKIHGDIARIAQLMNNLLSNAIKFTPRNGRVTVRTATVMKNGSAGVEISVEDTGAGIRPEDQSRIFQRFHRGRDKGTEGESGAGLGLCICKEIMQLHEGTLEVQTSPGKGAVFKAWFPARSHETLEKSLDSGSASCARDVAQGFNSPGKIDAGPSRVVLNNRAQALENLGETSSQRPRGRGKSSNWTSYSRNSL